MNPTEIPTQKDDLKISLSNEEFQALTEGKQITLTIQVDPQPQGDSLDSYLEGKWLAKPFLVEGEPLLLPTISQLPRECPYGQIGEVIKLTAPTAQELEVIILSIEVKQLGSTDSPKLNPADDSIAWFWVIEVKLFRKRSREEE